MYRILFLGCLTVLISAFRVTETFAEVGETFTDNHFYYTIISEEEKTVSITATRDYRDIPTEVIYNNVPYRVVKVDDYVFNNAFLEYVAIDKELIIPEGIEELGDYCFAQTFEYNSGWHTLLENTVYKTLLPYSLKKIGSNCFSDSYNVYLDLKNVEYVGDEISKVSDRDLFLKNELDGFEWTYDTYQNAILKGIRIRTDKFHMTKNSFNGTKLEHVICDSPTPWEDSVIDGEISEMKDWNEAVLHVPSGSGDTYRKFIKEGKFPEVKEVKEMNEPELLLFVQDLNNVVGMTTHIYYETVWLSSWVFFQPEDFNPWEDVRKRYKIRYEIVPIGGAEIASAKWASSDRRIVYFIDDSEFECTKRKGIAKLRLTVKDNYGKDYTYVQEFIYGGDYAGIDDPQIEPGEGDIDYTPEYYTLNGMSAGHSADTLAPGLYIERRGAKSRKILVQ